MKIAPLPLAAFSLCILVHAGATGAELTDHYHFRLVKGRQVEVCQAYAKRLNNTSFSSPPYCGRPEDDSVTGFVRLNRVDVGLNDEQARFGLVYNLEYPLPLGAVEPDGFRDIRNGKTRLSSNVGGALNVWRYDPEVDLNNDGQPDNVWMWQGVEFGGASPPCNSHFLIDPGAGLRLEQLPVIFTADNQAIDTNKTKAIIAHPTQTYDARLNTGNLYSSATPFRPIARSIGIFKYKDAYYFDGFFDVWGDAQNQRRGREGLANIMGVFLHKDHHTTQVCEIQWLSSDFPHR
jgi:hypothetical protein